MRFIVWTGVRFSVAPPYALVAQGTEQLPSKQLVVGSNPTEGARFFADHIGRLYVFMDKKQ